MTKHEDSAALSGVGSSDLLDCPFCGCDQIHLEERAWVVPFSWYCRNCRMYGPAAGSIPQAATFWNRLPRKSNVELTETP